MSEEFSDVQKKSLEMLDKYLAETPAEEVQALIDKYVTTGCEGPTLADYRMFYDNEIAKLKVLWMSLLREAMVVEWLLLGFEPIDPNITSMKPKGWKLRVELLSESTIFHLQNKWRNLLKDRLKTHNAINKLVGNPTTNETYSKVVRTSSYRFERGLLKKRFRNYTIDNPPSKEILRHFLML